MFKNYKNYIIYAVIAILAVIILMPGLDCGMKKELKKNIMDKVFAEEEVKKEVKIMTFNIRRGSWIWGWDITKRKDKIINIINSYDLDIVCLQEALEFQYKDIQEALIEFNSYGVGRGNGENKGEFCPIFYRKDRFELMACGTFWYSDTPDNPGSKEWGNIVPRICSWVQLKDGDKIFYVYNTHLPYFSDTARRKSIALLIEKVESPFIIVGDFNVNVNNPIMEDMAELNCHYFESHDHDYIFASEEIVIKDHCVDETKNNPSDHRALISILEL